MIQNLSDNDKQQLEKWNIHTECTDKGSVVPQQKFEVPLMIAKNRRKWITIDISMIMRKNDRLSDMASYLSIFESFWRCYFLPRESMKLSCNFLCDKKLSWS